MPKFKCINQSCTSFQDEVFFAKTTSIYDKNKGEFVVKEAVCKSCGAQLEFIHEKDSFDVIPLKTSMMSREDKMKMLKKRSSDLSIPENRRLRENKRYLDNTI